MSDFTVRPFARPDRDGLTALVNAHVAAVVPGASVSTATLLAQLEREPREPVEDPWVVDRATLVVEADRRLVGAAHLQRFSPDDAAPAGLRGVGAIRWLVFEPGGPDAGRGLLEACVRVARAWGSRVVGADGTLPVPGVYGVPEQWPHVLDALRDAGFASDGRVETVWLAPVSVLPEPGPAPLPGLSAVRAVGVQGVRFSAVLVGRTIGFVELDTTLDAGSQRPRNGGLADIGNLWVEAGFRRRGVARWLLGTGAEWLRLGEVGRLLAYTLPPEHGGDDAEPPFLSGCGFRPLTRTVRDLTL
ncbi:N-acetyltransferase [Spongisporangium articulatum]|uniref:N-acetyltransferase n=1 Tax=Spongisporangium articulatum TaxID=3362603 RepID=A0ABW8AKX7_9ACTN